MKFLNYLNPIIVKFVLLNNKHPTIDKHTLIEYKVKNMIWIKKICMFFIQNTKDIKKK